MSEEEERAEFERIMSAVNWDFEVKCDNEALDIEKHGPAKGRLFCEDCHQGNSFCGSCMGAALLIIAGHVAIGETPRCANCGSENIGIEVLDKEVGEEETPIYEETKKETGIDPERKNGNVN